MCTRQTKRKTHECCYTCCARIWPRITSFLRSSWYTLEVRMPSSQQVLIQGPETSAESEFCLNPVPYQHSTCPKTRSADHLWERKMLTMACENHVVFRTLSVVYRPDGTAICGLCGDENNCMRLQNFPGLGCNRTSLLMMMVCAGSKLLTLGTACPFFKQWQAIFPRQLCFLIVNQEFGVRRSRGCPWQTEKM